jgi:phenylacetate-coenzyme A ligase PaaK-like adenylate-forming protein
VNSPKKKIKDFIIRFRPLPDYYSNDFKKDFAFMMESRDWCKEKIRNYRLGQIKALVRHAQKNVPYYRGLLH